MKGKFSAQAVVAAKPPTKKIKKAEEEQKTFFGIDLHKEFLQVAAVDQDGTLLMNKGVTNDFGTIAKEFTAFPKDAKYVLESSSVWYGVYKNGPDPARIGPIRIAHFLGLRRRKRHG